MYAGLLLAVHRLYEFERLGGNLGSFGTFCEYPPEVRKIIYTMNIIEGFTHQLALSPARFEASLYISAA